MEISQSLNRLCLNYKGLPYKTEWLEYPEIEPHYIKHGIKPTSTKPDGSPFYTLPAIYDGSTGVYTSDSFAIAVYLDDTYPSTPLIFPHGTRGLQAAFESAFLPQVKGVLPFTFRNVLQNLNEPSVKYMVATKRVQMGGKEPVGLVPSGEEAVVQWAKAEEELAKVAGWYANNERKGPLLMGEVVSWADIVVCAHLLCWRVSLGADSKEWRSIEKWNGSIWGTLVKAMEAYQEIA